jgi:hypothetical protein
MYDEYMYESEHKGISGMTWRVYTLKIYGCDLFVQLRTEVPSKHSHDTEKEKYNLKRDGMLDL